MKFQRWTQTVTLSLFLVLLVFSVAGLLPFFSKDFFLRLDPSIALITTVSARVILLGVLPVVIVVLLSIWMGRFFCGHICPMGTTLDVSDRLFGTSYKKQKKLGRFRPLKYLVLAYLLTGSLFGVSYVFLASPLSLITRFYGLVIYPVITFLGNGGHQLAMPLWEKLDINALLFFQIPSNRYATQFFIFLFFSLLFVLPGFTPRFWCRYICPAGAILALFAWKPIIRRQVDSSCNDCGKCVRSCPMNAIDEEKPERTNFSECIVCLNCEKICTEQSVCFSSGTGKPCESISQGLPGRRAFISAAAAGLGTAVLSFTGLNTTIGKTGEGQVLPETLVRPPATLPELEFLSRCMRCAECVAACPTNTLQPIWFEAGTLALFSPAMILRRGYCDPDCHHCAEVCPTEAIIQVSKSERLWAKTGTAVINREKCLAWEHNQKCMVCDETCPFGAIEFNSEQGLDVTVPKVLEYKCSGCGYCEYHCPVQNQPAISVSPMNALRLTTGSFRERGEKNGLIISRKEIATYTYPDDARGSPSEIPGFNSAPGFEVDDSSELPPGFTN